MANYAALKNIQAFMRYFGKYPNDTSLADIQELFLPYRYGHATQVQLVFGPVCKLVISQHMPLDACTWAHACSPYKQNIMFVVGQCMLHHM